MPVLMCIEKGIFYTSKQAENSFQLVFGHVCHCKKLYMMSAGGKTASTCTFVQYRLPSRTEATLAI